MHNRAHHLFERALDCGDKTALIFESEQYSFGDIARRVRETAGGLAQLGIGQGTHVGILIPSSPDFIFIQQALFALGAVITPLNILYRPNEIAHAISSCDLTHLISTEMLLRPLDGAFFPHAKTTLISVQAEVTVGPIHSLSEAVAVSEPLNALVEIAPNDVTMLLLTSATTGKSKGVMLTAANLAANYDRTPEWLAIDRDTTILCALPLYNTFGLNQGINALLVTGGTMVLLPRFDATQVISAISEHRCTFLPAVPTMLQKIVDHPAARATALSSLSCIMTGGAPVPAALLQRVLAAAPHTEVLTGYGLTEGTALVTLTPVRLGSDGDIEHGRTIGRALNGMTVDIIDANGRILPSGEHGEIAIRGPNVMAGYYRAPEDTKVALGGGWLRSGDIGYVNEEGYVYIVDRMKDVIIRGGQNIYPADIEEILYQMPGVTEAAVIGIPDELMGEVPVAFVAIQPGCILTVEAMINRCKAELAPFKLPNAIHMREELPKGPTGKILRRALRSDAAAA